MEVGIWSKVMRSQREATELDGFNWEAQGFGMYVEMTTLARMLQAEYTSEYRADQL